MAYKLSCKIGAATFTLKNKDGSDLVFDEKEKAIIYSAGCFKGYVINGAIVYNGNSIETITLVAS